MAFGRLRAERTDDNSPEGEPAARLEESVQPVSNGGRHDEISLDHRELLTAERWALFLDVDGTIVDIADRPDSVVVDPALATSLLALREHLGGALALISGRSIATLDELLAPAHLDAAGLHGLEWRHNGVYHGPPATTIARVRQAVIRLKRGVAHWNGVLVEDKGATVAVHFRLAPHRQREVRDLVSAIIADLGPDFRMQTGKAVLEIVHEGAGKQRAISRFLDLPPYRNRYPIFAGDDETDEDALALVNEVGGLSVHVGSHLPTIAHVRLTSPSVMRGWLTGLAGNITRSE